MIQELSIPGYPGYTINTQGKVFHNGKPKSLIHKPGRAPKLRIQENGKKREWGVATLMATLFLPNPGKLHKVVFKDGNFNNLHTGNIQWVSNREYVRHNLHRGLPMEVCSKAKTPKTPPLPDPLRVPVQDMPGYFISPAGLLYHGSRLLKICRQKGRAASVRMRCSYTGGLTYRNLATLLAQHFIPNPRKQKHIIFKDRNHHNCSLHNIAWASGHDYMQYCLKNMGSRKIQGSREEALARCTEGHLLMYYKTGEESWLHRYWNRLEKRVNLHNWEEYRAECYLYFLDRAQRFSLYHDPIGLLMLHCRKLRSREWKEMGAHLPLQKMLQTDESLRTAAHERYY